MRTGRTAPSGGLPVHAGANDRERILLRILDMAVGVRLDQPVPLFLSRMAQGVVALTGCEEAVFYIRDRDESTLSRVAYSGTEMGAEPPPEKLARVFVDELLARASTSGPLARLVDATADPRIMPSRVIVAVPLTTAWNGPIGVLLCGFARRPMSGAESIFALEALAPVCAQSIQNARLYQGQADRAMELEESSSARQDFVSIVSHELRTPLTAISGFIETLMEYWDRLDDERRLEMLDKSRTAAHRLNRLVQDLLLVSRLDVHSLGLTLQRVPLRLVVDQSAAEVRGKYRGQEMRTDVPVDIVVYGDSQRIEQILVNLFDNAAKYSPEGAPIVVEASEADGVVTVRVIDAGPGVDPKLAHLLFTRFGKLGSAMRAGHIGMGLGLYISRELVEAMGGRIWLDQTGSTGSTFSFTLPSAIPEIAGTKVPADDSTAQTETPHGTRTH